MPTQEFGISGFAHIQDEGYKQSDEPSWVELIGFSHENGDEGSPFRLAEKIWASLVSLSTGTCWPPGLMEALICRRERASSRIGGDWPARC